MAKKRQISVNDAIIQWQQVNNQDYISLTDMAKGFEGDPRDYIRNWLRTGSTIEFLGTWEQLHNADFNVVEFHHIKSQFTENTFLMSTKKWIERTQAIGLMAKSGRYGGTYAHSDIAIVFANWLSPSFYVYLVKEFQRLKDVEQQRLGLEWDANRFLTKRNYRLQTEAIKTNLIPMYERPRDDEWITYAEEADLLNVALFGITAKQWREANPKAAEGGFNIRDRASNIELIVLSNLEAINSELIREALPKEERFLRLQQAALFQLQIFVKDGKKLE